jgi:hypothetical protein
MATGEARMPNATSLPPHSALPRDTAERLRERGYGTPAG